MAYAYIPVTITNSESTATPTDFQQLVTVDLSYYSAFLNQDLSNTFFSSDTAGSTVVTSWLESGNTYPFNSVNFWLYLPDGIGASSSITVYLQVDLSGANHFNDTTTGVAPQLTSTYAEYDDGANVFTNYWNFAGTTAPSDWTYNAGSISYNNGVTFNSTASGSFWYYTGATYSGNLMIDELMKVNTQGLNGEGAVGLTTTTPSWTSTFSAALVYNNTIPKLGIIYLGTDGDTAAEFEPVGTFGILGFSATSSGMEIYSNYQKISSSTDAVPSSYYIVGSEASAGAQVFIQWLRTRAYPPSGVMPSVSAGTPSNFPYYNTTTYEDLL